eukprot:CAMPEP_0198203234 /NCGR_PEP_ID=MMETSP1445-20131203/6486_1 /TAXON_ID=36898 /ORGANISM="Pyramimonas sp., Strain CCMP2087" /LENGTH=295 /DNA_ID=CAMNT_0043874527 /DNA_START=326 /DNA_END=1213 /DNA_ORIENTATION=-
MEKQPNVFVRMIRGMGVFVGWMIDTRYWVEWVTSLLIIIAVLYVTAVAEPRHRLTPMPDGFLDPNLSFPIEPSIVSVIDLWVTILVVPFFVGMFSIAFGSTWLDVHHLLLSILQAVSLGHAFTDPMQMAVGRQRPTWFERIEDDSGIRSGRMSYPSGHATYSTSAMMVLSLYLLSKIRVFRRDRYQMVLVVFGLSPIVIAVFIGTSRIMDHHHHFEDINAGFFIGTFTGFIGFHLNYPPVWNKNAGRPNTRGSRVYEKVKEKEEEARDKAFQGSRKGQDKGMKDNGDAFDVNAKV